MKLKQEARHKRLLQDRNDFKPEIERGLESNNFPPLKQKSGGSFFSLSKRAYSRFFASLAILGLWLFIGIKECSAYGDYSKQHEAQSQKPQTKIAALQSGYPKLTVIADGAAEKVLDVAPAAIVLLNNEPSSLKDLNKGDAVNYELNSSKEVSKIVARRTAGGYVLSADRNSITITPDYTQRTTISLSPEPNLS